jgi:hypothetical protein
MLSMIGIKKTIKQHTADMDITDSVDYKIKLQYLNHVCYITHIGLIPLCTIKMWKQVYKFASPKCKQRMASAQLRLRGVGA